MRLVVVDLALQEQLGEKIAFDFDERTPPKSEAKHGFAKVTQDKTAIYAGASKATDTLALAKAGTTLKIAGQVSEHDGTYYRVWYDAKTADGKNKSRTGYVLASTSEVVSSDNK